MVLEVIRQFLGNRRPVRPEADAVCYRLAPDFKIPQVLHLQAKNTSVIYVYHT